MFFSFCLFGVLLGFVCVIFCAGFLVFFVLHLKNGMLFTLAKFFYRTPRLKSKEIVALL